MGRHHYPGARKLHREGSSMWEGSSNLKTVNRTLEVLLGLLEFCGMILVGQDLVTSERHMNKSMNQLARPKIEGGKIAQNGRGATSA